MVLDMVLATAPARTLGVKSGGRLRFGEEETAGGAWAGRRLLFVDEMPAFELSFWCGTCPFLFRRLEGSNDTVSLAETAGRLADGIKGLDDDVVDAFASLLPLGEYVPLLLAIQPRLLRPVQTGDYYAEDQMATWGLEPFWGLPESPRTPYYRTFETAVETDAHLYEFVVPMVPPSWNNTELVAEHERRLSVSSRPTAVAVSTLDVCAPAVDSAPGYCAHWGLTHFLLDGHHKLQAAADSSRSLQLLSLLSVEGSLAAPEDVCRVPKLRARRHVRRSNTA